MVNVAPWKIWVTLAILLAGIIFAAPNLLTPSQAEQIPRWLPHQQISLGLDLQGGSHLLFEVDVAAVVRERLEATRDAVREVLRRDDIRYTGLSVSGNGVNVQLSDPTTGDKVESLLQDVAPGMQITVGADGKVRIEYTEEQLVQLRNQVMEQSIEIVRRRIDDFGVKEPTIIRQGDDRIVVQLPGLGDPTELEKLIGTTAKMTFQLVNNTVPTPVPEKPTTVPPGSIAYESEDGGWEIVERQVILTGENLVDASAGNHPTTGRPIVNFEFDSIGARKFGRVTHENVGRRFAVILDNKVITAPRINEPIPGGRGLIEGNFTADSAHVLAVQLRAGALPAQLTVQERRTVGPELGADSIQAGKMASIMGLVLICAALIAAYGLFGLFANIALVFNFILLIAAMSVLGATLTLPGIAGMVLTLGMAVDANVLIHERIREEIRAGRGPVMAIDAGYRAAAGTIMDSNLTVIISSFFLLILGSGPVRGFAITLMIGTIISMFTAVVVARLCTVMWLRRTRPQIIPI
jgi:protein-export membrane protein SecD